MAFQFVFSGFGGQGVLFAGKVTANTGLIDGKQVTWLPSYGPEMRGGTANCSVCLSEEPIGCPMVMHPDVLIAMNGPSFDRFAESVRPGGLILADSTLVECDAQDHRIRPIPATRLAADNGLEGLANILLLGGMLRLTGFTTYESMQQAIRNCVPASKAYLLEANFKAFQIGFQYQ